MQVSLELLKKLREETSAGVSDCRQALEDAKGDYDKAKKLVEKMGFERASKKEGRETKAGIIESYIHAGRHVGVLVELQTETDFVAENEAFRSLGHELALQIAAMNPKNVRELLKSEYIRDTRMTISDLVKSTIAKVGENITIARFTRFAIGEK